ncbi:MAG: tRNA (guanosine(46)-N7)-methyltransferase TrmB [Prochlorothrix sp.]
MSVRVRQHVNPLSQKFQQGVPLPDWGHCYGHLQAPFHLDIGSARGRFLLDLAPLRPDWNFLGLEIRESLVTAAQGDRDRLQLTNLHFLFCNANISLAQILTSLPPGQLRYVSIQFPDPWFKKRHQKRRVVQPDLVQTLADCLAPGAIVFLQSDVEAVAVAMVECFQAHPAFMPEGETWLPQNPLPVPTEREIATLKRGEPVYRQLFTRRAADQSIG